MATLPDLYRHLLTGRNEHITNKRYNVSKVVDGFTMIDPAYSTDLLYQEGIELSKRAHELYKEGLKLPEDSPESSAKIHAAAKLYRDALNKLHRYEYDTFKAMKYDLYYKTYQDAYISGANHTNADRVALEKVNQLTWKLPIKVPQSKKIRNAIRNLQAKKSAEDDALFTLSPVSPRSPR